MNHMPIIRMEVEGMRHAILTALSEHHLQLDEQFKAAVNDFCKPENIQQIINEAAARELKSAIDTEVRNFFQYNGEGRKMVAEAIKAKLIEGYTTLD